MTSLNQAFIKAYRKSESSTAPPAPLPTPHFSAARAEKQSALIGATTTGKAAAVQLSVAAPEVVAPLPALAAAPVPDRAADESAQPTFKFEFLDSPHASVPAPHANFAEPPAAVSAPDAADQSPAVTLPLPSPPAAPVTVEAPPISPRPVILPMVGTSLVWRPVYEVASFTWPDTAAAMLDAAAPQFRVAANELIEAGRRHRKLVTVTAARRGEGCTLVALALARSLAEQKQKVILVDAHFDAPQVAESLGVAAQVGWEDHLAGDKPLIEALVESLDDGLTVLPLRLPAAEDFRLSFTRLKSSFDELRRHCDIVLVDAGPMGEQGDRRHLLSWAAPCRVDRALVVYDLRTSGDEEIAAIDQRLHGCGIAQWNFVENFTAA